MSSAQTMSWHEANQSYSLAALADVRAAIERLLAGADKGEEPASETALPMADAALERLCRSLDLSAFERKILVMCAGVEWDSQFAEICAGAQGEGRRQPTFSLALAAFGDAHWSALSPSRPLRYWRLIHVMDGEAVTTARLRIDERVLHYLGGVQSMDAGLRPLVQPLNPPPWLVPSQDALAEAIASAWSDRQGQAVLPVIQLCGNEAAGKRAIAAAACGQVGLTLYAMPARNVPLAAAEADMFRRLWEREALLSSSALLVECGDSDGGEGTEETAVSWLMEYLGSPLILSTRTARRSVDRSTIVFHAEKPTSLEQDELWRNEVEAECPNVNGSLRTLVSQFSLGSAAIHSAAAQARRECHAKTLEMEARLWDACRVQSRPRLEGLAQRIEAAANWDDLVVPDKQRDVLRRIVMHVRHRAQVYDSWGFASKGARGLGISALFAGTSGTGKTMAAEVLAAELRLDLYRIDLSQVVSKYIGETEKNLRRLFDAADEGAAILLFDEADALFGKRGEVKDSHDRYANIEVSYLLQRMEAYRGLAILTTNRRSALDQAFLRRIRFAVEFPFPDAMQREQIWSRVFPRATPTEGLRIERLARMNASGAHIRNIAMSAAFLAADAGQPVRMSHLLAAARGEFDKIERPLTDVEVAGWV